MKKNFDRERFLQMFIILTCLIVLTFQFLSANSKAQTSCLPNKPPLLNETNPQYNAWDQFKNISVVIFDRPGSVTSDAEFNAINAGIQDWNNIKVSGCSNVTLENAVRAGRAWDGVEQPPNDTIYVVRTTERFGQWVGINNSISGQWAGRLYLHSDFDHQTSNQLYRIDNLAKHEAGHSFGIGNGLRSDPSSAYSQNSFTGSGNSLVITACDIAAHRRVYCPTPTPTPEPPDRCYVPRTDESEDGIFDDDFQMRPAEPSDCNENQQWNEETCQCDDNFPSTPIVIDTAGNGFDLTNAANGVRFDLNGDGIREKLSWTSANSDDAWLALDRNGDGMITTGTELFGNYTPQPPPPRNRSKNGFIALAEYDKLANGGNSDGKINHRDLIFGSLRLWRDANHDGISEQSEIFDLRALEVRAIDLDYLPSRRTDEHGNRFKYRAKVRDEPDANVGRWAWDVFLVLEQPPQN